MLLPCQFYDITQNDKSNFFNVFLKKQGFDTKIQSIFDAQNRRWLVDTSGRISIQDEFDKAEYVVIYDNKIKKSAVIDGKGNFIVPAIYDELILESSDRKLFIARKGATYQLLNFNYKRKRPTYEFLKKVVFVHFSNGDFGRDLVFIAKLKGKWGVIDSNDRVLYPFAADYAAVSDNGFLLVEGTSISYYDAQSFPNKGDITNFFKDDADPLQSKNLADDTKQLFFFNDKGKLVIPPQYRKTLKHPTNYQNYTDGYVLVEDVQKHRKLVSTETGKITDFPFDFRLRLTENNCQILVVSDDNLSRGEYEYAQNLGVVTVDGRLLTPCINSGISIADTQIGTYFVRRDTPVTGFNFSFRRVRSDTLTDSDNNWFLYNKEGKLIDNEPFRYPINFEKGLGIGMKGESFGIFSPNGSIIVPPQYANIRRHERTGFYYLFRNQGLTVTASLKNQEGKTLVEEGRYDRISSFYGQYALVRSEKKIGLIDALGKEIVALQDLFTTNNNNLLDSLGIFNKGIETNVKLLNDGVLRLSEDVLFQLLDLPVLFYGKYSLDSLNLSSTLRNTVSNMILEKIQDNVLWRANDVKIERNKRNAGKYYIEHRISHGTGRSSEEEMRSYRCHRVIASEKSVSFILGKFAEYYQDNYLFSNFYRKDNRWNELKINDLLFLQGEKRGQFNDFLIQKVRALQDADIDCSNTLAFVSTVENRFLLTNDGVDFHFSSHKDHRDFVIVSFTWAELQPFLKMRL